MRSVVVVLPASMCAMIPMLRVLASSAALAISLSRLPCGRFCWYLLATGGVPAGFSSEAMKTWWGALPAVVREGLVGLGHLVGVLASLDAGAKAVAGVEDLVHQA